MKRTPLSRFESLAQRLVEGSFKRIFDSQLEPLEVANRLARALEDSAEDGQAADHYIIHLHPEDYDSVLRDNVRLAEDLVEYVIRLAQQAGVSLKTRPQIELVANPNIARHHILVQAKAEAAVGGATTQMKPVDLSGHDPMNAIEELDAFLIIEGRQHLPLDRPLMTLGRRVDNDIVLDSPSISRQHAQIRWRYGRFILYDLGGRGRTLVNGQVVTECVLQAGDVISLSNVPIIYGEGREDRMKRHSSADDRSDPTLLMPKS